MKLGQLNLENVVVGSVHKELCRYAEEKRVEASKQGCIANVATDQMALDIIASINIGHTIMFKRQDNFTVALIVSKAQPVDITVGVSKRHPNDEQDPVKAHALALNKAVCAFVRKHVASHQ